MLRNGDEIMKNKLVLNTVASFICFFLNIIISLVVSPIIVEYVGGDAYGYVKVASDFANYALVITVALNSVAARFISIAYHQNKVEEANKYFNSVFWMNVILSVCLFVVGLAIIVFLEKIINIPDELVVDVKVLFLFVFLNFILSVISTVITVATYIKNVLYISSIINAISSILKIIIIFSLFYIVTPQIWILGFANLSYTFLVCILNNYFRVRLVPELKITIQYFSKKNIIEMLKEGIWSSLSNLSQIFSDGLDLLISNIFISPLVMGQLAIAKTVSSLMSSLIGTLTNLFNPNLTYYYAKNMNDKVVKEFQLSMKFTAFISGIPVCIFAVLGKEFFELWVPSQNGQKIFLLASLCIVSVVVSGVTSPLNNVFVLTNHLKTNSIVWFVVSIIDICIVFLMLKFTNLGVYAVAGVSSIVGMIVNLIYLPFITAKYLCCKATKFYRVIGRHFFSLTIGYIMVYLLSQKFLWDNTWISLIVKFMICGIVLVIIFMLVLLDGSERKKFKAILLRR